MSVHCRNPARCSVCIGAKPRVVELVDGQVLVDGVPDPDRDAQPETMSIQQRNAAARGVAHSPRANRRKPR